MPRMNGGEAIVRSLASEGVRALFGIPGTQGLPLFDALHDAPQIRRITARHEQGAAYMADGYARASGEIGVCTVPTGPGALNTLAAMGTAYTDSSPILNIFTQIPSPYVGRMKGYLHEIREQMNAFAEVTGYRARVDSVSAIPYVVRDAMAAMRNRRPRPAAIEVPKDVEEATGDAPILEPLPRTREPGPEDQIEAAAGVLARSSRPLIWVGGGVISSGGCAELARLAEAIQAPVYTTVTGKGSIPADHPLSLGCLPLRQFVREYVKGCDVVLVVGSRLSRGDTGEWSLALPDEVVQVDLDPQEIGRNYPTAAAIVGDAKTVLAQLLSRLETSSQKRPARAGEVADLRAKVMEDSIARSADAVRLIQAVRGAVPRDGIVVSDVTIPAYWANHILDVYEPRTYQYPWGFVTLGYGLSAAMGAKVAKPDKTVLAICGDGGFMYDVGELASAVQFGINVVALVVNSESFGILAPEQTKRFGRTTMVDLHNPDFVALARSFGAYGVRAESVDEVGGALQEAMGSGKPAIVELKATLNHPFDWQL